MSDFWLVLAVIIFIGSFFLRGIETPEGDQYYIGAWLTGFSVLLAGLWVTTNFMDDWIGKSSNDSVGQNGYYRFGVFVVLPALIGLVAYGIRVRRIASHLN